MDPSNSNGGKSPWNYALSGKIMLTAIVVLFTVVLLILFLHLYVRWHIIRRASRQARRRRRLVFSGEGQAAAVSAGNRGLDPSILASLAVLLFSDEGEEDESGECAVCLNEFEEGEKIRRLPDCAHRFHLDCIDMWFCSHSTCPLCRAAVNAVKETAASGSGALQMNSQRASLPDSSENELSSSRLPEEDLGSSSSASGFQEVRIDVPANTAVVSSGEEDRHILTRESPEQRVLKLQSSRMVLIRWLLMRDPRVQRADISASETDLERGDREFHPNPPPHP
ncbi:RING-H2 finger protein ATL5 [Platanthera zijinensis]|uniref:RING-type E3 ubiquitin transferase n=1 Tax=Platanthera zijinensis TaxID=2320716 RepID=A0AAP0B4R9_9ASPA